MHQFLWVDRGITERLILHSQPVLAPNDKSPSYHLDLLIARVTAVNTASIMDDMSGVIDSLWSRSLLKVGIIC
jgi:hypothetical protein